MQSHEKKSESSIDSSELSPSFSRVLYELSQIYKQLTVEIPHRKYTFGLDGKDKHNAHRLGGKAITASVDEQEKFKNQFPACIKALDKIGSTLRKRLFYISSEESKRDERSFLYLFSTQAMGCLIRSYNAGNRKTPMDLKLMLYSLIGLLALPSNFSSRKPQNLDASETCSDFSASDLKIIFFKLNELIENKMILPLVNTLNQEVEAAGAMLHSYKVLTNPTMQKIIFSYFGENILCELQKGFTPNRRFLLSLWTDAVMALVGEQPGVSSLVSLIKCKILPSIDQQITKGVVVSANFSSEEMSFIQSVYHSFFDEPKREEIIQALQSTTASRDNIAGIFNGNEGLYKTFTCYPYAYPNNTVGRYACMSSVFFKLEKQDLFYLNPSINALKLNYDETIGREKNEKKQEDETSKASTFVLSFWKERLRLLAGILAYSSETHLCSHGLFGNKTLVGMVIDYLGIKIGKDIISELEKEAANASKRLA